MAGFLCLYNKIAEVMQMRFSKMFIPTKREIPTDVEIESHKLMIRSGMIKKSASGIYNQLPLGLNVEIKI